MTSEHRTKVNLLLIQTDPSAVANSAGFIMNVVTDIG
jgi:hypothetical protein